MKIDRRLAELERRMAPKRPPRIVVRYAGPGSRSSPQPEEDVDENTTVITVRFVEAKGVAELERAADENKPGWRKK